MLHQTFAPHDLLVIAILIGLEGILSIDNALVLGLLAKRLPKVLQTRALTYGLIGAIAFRIIAVALAAALLRWRWAKLIGGLYLLYVAGKHLMGADENADSDSFQGTAGDEKKSRAFWSTVLWIELTDIAFAVDSILAAIALVGAAAPGEKVHPKLWVVIFGGVAGVVLMRFAAVLFIRLLDRFPRFETSAYLLVLIIGAKMFIDWALNTPTHPGRIDFDHAGSPAFWIFWVLMAICIAIGFFPARKVESAASA